MLRLILGLLVPLFLSGCISFSGLSQYTVTMPELDMPMMQLQKLVAYELPNGLRATSENGQEFYSNYYVVNKGSYKPAGEALDRYFAQITVLGDRRPYQVEILVTREKRVLRSNRFDYITVGHDLGLAKMIEAKIKDELSKRREDRNIIDDFRVF